MTVSEEFLSFGLFVGQKKQFEEDTLGSGLFLDVPILISRALFWVSGFKK